MTKLDWKKRWTYKNTPMCIYWEAPYYLLWMLWRKDMISLNIYVYMEIKMIDSAAWTFMV